MTDRTPAAPRASTSTFPTTDRTMSLTVTDLRSGPSVTVPSVADAHHGSAPRRGRVTIPSEAGLAERTAEIGRLWGADAVRNSDGTQLDAEVLALGKRVYSAYFPVRGDNEFIRHRMEQCPQIYLSSERVLADGGNGSQGVLRIDLMRRYFGEQLRVNLDDDPARWWEVIDRTTGDVVPPEQWRVETVPADPDVAVQDGSGHSEDRVTVVVEAPAPFHEYTASFLAYIVWDPVEMYNHLTNDWGDKEHEIPYDIRHPETWEYVRTSFRQWLADHPDTDVVRFTTFFYQFTLVFDEQRREKFVDWFGYGATVSVPALERFEDVKGYRLRPEDFVDEGYYNSSFRIPSRQYLDYVDFTSEVVATAAAELVRMAHEAGKEAMMFLGDQWIGMEPYADRFPRIGLDAVVGSVGDGTTLRMISDIPGVRYTEGRFLPYFFPDTFYEGNDEAIEAEARTNWLQARRAILRSPIDRMGYGGYLSLAERFPGFVEAVAEITQEFRAIHHRIDGARPHSGLKVAVLNAWGRIRSWQAFTVAHALYNKQAYSYYGVLEALSGMAVDVEFLSFEDVIARGIDESVDVIINAGARDTAFSGGHHWRDERLVTTVRAWIASGGGLIGVGEPTATPHQGRYFQLADCLGVDREMSQSLSIDKYHHEPVGEHFITADVTEPLNLGESMGDVYALSPATRILEYSREEVHLAAHERGQGRAVYIAGLPYDVQNTRLLQRALFWAAGKEGELTTWFSENPACEVSAYPAAGVYCVANSTAASQTTVVHTGDGGRAAVELGPYELRWQEA